MNKVIIAGRLTGDPEFTMSQTATGLCKFSIAVNRVYTSHDVKKEETSFINCVAWGKIGENISKYFKKGSPILLEGRLQQNRWEKDGQKHSMVKIIVESFDFMDKKSDKNEHQLSPGEQVAKVFSDDDIPF